MRRARLLLLAAAALAASAHVGSPDAWYQGMAGPYRLLVHVEVPQVIPGIATVRVRAEDPSVTRVSAFADHADATGGAPPPEIAEPVDGEPGWFATRLWLMTTGSYGVTVSVDGPGGVGRVVVPVVAMPLRRLEFGGGLAFLLGALGILLLLGLLTIVAAAVREGVLPPGEEPDRGRRRRARRAVARATVVVALLLLGGWRWWRSEDAAFDRARFRPLATSASVDGPRLVLAIEDSLWAARHRLEGRPGFARPGAALIADHGKLMHLFLVAENGGAFAHLHPTTRDSVRFASVRPPLPAGRYRVFADIVQESGFAQTLVAAVDLPAPHPAVAEADPDDSWTVGSGGAAAVTLADGSTMTWLGGGAPLVAGEEAPLRFAVSARAAGEPALEPYMGMAGHAAVARDDGLVFAHLHPGGTFSTAAQLRFLERGGAALAHAAHAPAARGPATAADTIAFPYAFPEPGRYRIWVQVKRAGRVLTGAFRAEVR